MMLFSNLPSSCPHNRLMIHVNYVVGGVVIVCLSNLGLAEQAHSSRHMVRFAKALISF